MEGAFAGGYDPALELAQHSNKKADDADAAEFEELNELTFDGPGTGQLTASGHLKRREQHWIDRIVHGAVTGHYYVLLGPKGTGKATMIFDAMQANEAEGVAMVDAHPDLEVFRLRLGKALDYKYNEDSQTGLFQRSDPREGGPALDIERALNKLEKVALRSARRTNRPLVLILNNVHYFHNDEPGRNMLLQLQQRAESWAASGIMTLVFCTDDSWPFFLMRKTASRMHVLSIYDLSKEEALHALARMRKRIKEHSDTESSDKESILEAVSKVGGRLLYLNRVSKARDMVGMARHMLRIEKGWLLSQIGLIPDCDDDVMDEQKWSSCSWLLLQEFVKLRLEQEEEHRARKGEDAEEASEDDYALLPIPSIPYWRCRQIMTRPDFLEDLDRANIIAIDVHHDVRPDSMLILHAAREVVEEEGFQDMLDGVKARVDEIESLHRTRELTFKDVDKGDRIRLSVDKGGALMVDS
ncbi:hypothetical protein FIBSPDRAFT_948523 [Athelia psychrophila]|uniref:AAA protein C-terminal winged helix domain-containing protein n=2 Tax=Athelia psychrophila TaxID=1759441 RepID=A0A166QVW9_9AGAM|nr:hypothetical protein FIBSPDRAFT_948523 [Fibularhizoctonia sp. CBS 109695]